MENIDRKIRKNRKQLYRQRQRLKRQICFALCAFFMALVILQIRDIDRQLKQIQMVLKRIELPQYESEHEPEIFDRGENTSPEAECGTPHAAHLDRNARTAGHSGAG